MSLTSKSILVFGGASKITLSIVETLALQGAKLHFLSSSPLDSTPHAYTYEHINYYDFALLNEYVVENFNHPFDGIVYAGGKGGVRPLKLNSGDFIQSMFHENVFTFFEIIRLLLKKRCINDKASIVALSSVSSVKGLKSKSVYSSSKAALDAAVRGMAAELADKRIRVNSIQKGWVSADMNLDFIKSSMAVAEESDFSKQILGAIEPDELSNLVSFLLSDAVTTLTGTNLLLDGGYTL